MIAYPFVNDPNEVTIADRIQIQQFQDGTLTVRTHEMSAMSIGSQLSTDTELTAMDAVIPVVHNDTGSWYGESDYVDINTLVEEIADRLSGIKDVADKHSSPHVYLPASVVQRIDGNSIDLGETKIIPIEENDETPGYLTWDASLSAQFQQVDKVQAQLFIMSNLSPSLFGEQRIGSVDSGLALKRLAIPTILRLQHLRQAHEQALKRVIVAMKDSMLVGGDTDLPGFNDDDIQITWPELLRDSEKEAVETEIMKLGAGLTTREESISRIEGLGPMEAEKAASQAQMIDPDSS